jgi:hypothetical protein
MKSQGLLIVFFVFLAIVSHDTDPNLSLVPYLPTLHLQT